MKVRENENIHLEFKSPKLKILTIDLHESTLARFQVSGLPPILGPADNLSPIYSAEFGNLLGYGRRNKNRNFKVKLSIQGEVDHTFTSVDRSGGGLS